MDISIVFSCVAVLISLTGTWFVWQRDRRDKERYVWEQERRHRDRTPELHGGIERMSASQAPARYRLWIELDSSESLTSLRVELPDDGGLQFTPGQNGVGHDPVLLVATWDELATTRRAVWRIEQTVVKKRTVRVVVRCRIGADDWLIPVAIETPSSPAYVSAARIR